MQRSRKRLQNNILKEAFLLILHLEIAIFHLSRRKRQRALMLVVYPLPGKGLRYSGKAWEWTVCFGIWRLAMPEVKWAEHRSTLFLFNPTNANEGTPRHEKSKYEVDESVTK